MVAKSLTIKGIRTAALKNRRYRWEGGTEQDGMIE